VVVDVDVCVVAGRVDDVRVVDDAELLYYNKIVQKSTGKCKADSIGRINNNAIVSKRDSL
jgi:hypothetical protein